MASLLRRILIGSPLPTHRAKHERLPKFLALPVFASDALSSSAYATQEILVTLLAAGAGLAAFRFSLPIAACIITLLAIVTISYQQTIHAYPSGGGAYIVARDNLGIPAALTAGAALLIDYVLTVAVSVAAGIDAIVSSAAHNAALFQSLSHWRIEMCLLAVALITIANLRGVKESGAIFALPSYGFVAIGLLMIGWGTFKALHGDLHASETHQAAVATGTVGTLLLLKAFSSGCAALTGVEAISNGVSAFRPPEARNAGITMIWMAAILGVLFLGITYLARHLEITYAVGGETVISQVGRAVLGNGPLYLFLQAATAGILILAANTSFADFPRLSALLGADGFLPRQLANIGDRLVFNNGIVALGVISGLIIAVFSGHTDYLIPLYAVGVFLSFTLSQSGMVRRWYRLRTPRWQLNALINGVGALATGIVMLVIAVSKWAAGEHLHVGKLAIPTGAWMVVVMVPTLVYMFYATYNHYRSAALQLTLGDDHQPEPRVNTVLVPIAGMHRGIIPALQFARALSPDVRAVYIEIDAAKTVLVRASWERWGEGATLVVLESPYRSLVQPLLEYIDEVEHEREDDVIVLVIPEFVPAKWWEKLLHGHSGLLLKLALLHKRNIIVCNVRYFLEAAAARLPFPAEKERAGLRGTLPSYEVMQEVREQRE